MMNDSYVTKCKSLDSDVCLQELLSNAVDNSFVDEVLNKLPQKLTEARREYFSKPVASVPFGVSLDHGDKIIKLHPEIREVKYEPEESLPEGVFLACKHLAVRRSLLQLLSIDSGLSENPYAQRILTSGIEARHHSFVWKTQVPMEDIPDVIPSDILKFYMVIDLCSSTVSFDRLSEIMAHKKIVDATVIAPYDSTMWTHKGGRITSADYTFEWLSPKASSFEGYCKPTLLPNQFFEKSSFDDWSLYIQPSGVTYAYKIPRNHFIKFFGGVNFPGFFEVKSVRNGFAEFSYISVNDNIGDITTVQQALQRVMVTQYVAPGYTIVPRTSADGIKEVFRLGRQYDLSSDAPCLVKTSYLNAAKRLFMTIKVGRDVIPAMMRSLHSNSAKLVYNGAIVVADNMVDVESMCVVLEYVVKSQISAKIRVTSVSSLAKMPISAKPVDYAQSIAGWAGYRVMSSIDLSTGASHMTNIFNKLKSGQDVSNIDVDCMPDEELQYSYPDVKHTDPDKAELVDVIQSYTEDVFGYGFTYAYNLQRQDIEISKKDTFNLRRMLVANSIHRVPVEHIQYIYDNVFKGNSMIFPTENQMMNEQGDYKFTIDVQYFRMSIPALFKRPEQLFVVPSRLRTSVAADLCTDSFRSLMGSLMKRNFNRPRPEAPGNRRLFVEASIDQVLCNFAHKRHRMLISHYKATPIVISKDVIDMWAQTHTKADVLSAATMIEKSELEPDIYRLMPKDVPKPAMSLTAQGTIAVGQTVVYHSKDIIAITAGMFTLIISRLLTLFDCNIRFAFGADEHTSGEWADRYLDMPDVFVTEIDVPKFDKTQDWACFELILSVMRLVGVESDMIEFWRKASEKASVFSSLFHLTFTTMFGNRSGNAGTLATNCVVILFAYLSSFLSTDVVAILIKGDDSVLVTRKPLTSYHADRLLEDWGFSMKIMERRGNITSFCSSFFVKDSFGKYRLVRDVMRVVEKLGRALSATKPAAFFLDYYVALVDTALMYDDDVVVNELTRAVSVYYGTPVDVPTIVQFIKYISSNSRIFLKELYGLTEDQINNLSELDDAAEILSRTKSIKFIKAKQLGDGYKQVKLSLIDKMKISSDWIFD